MDDVENSDSGYCRVGMRDRHTVTRISCLVCSGTQQAGYARSVPSGQTGKGRKDIPHVHIVGSDNSDNHHGILTFTVDGCHPHDISEIMNSYKVNVRAGHHCAQPLTKWLGLNSTTRASIGFYNNEQDIDRFIECIAQIRGKLGYGE